MPTTWSRAWNIRFGRPVALDEARGARRRSRAGRRRCSGTGRPGCAGCRRTPRWRPIRTVPCSSVTSLGLLRRPWRPGAGVLDAAVDVGHLQGDVDDAVTVLAVVVQQGALRRDPALDDEAGRAALEHERLVVAVAGLRAAVGDQLHPEGGLVVVRGLGGVADDEHQGVPPGHREGVLALVVRHQADELLELVEVEVGVALCRAVRAIVSVMACAVDHPRSLGNRHRSALVRRLRNTAGQTRSRLDTLPMRSTPSTRRLITCSPSEPQIGVLRRSRRLGVARGTVQARLDRLVERGVVTHVAPHVDPAALGFPVTAFVTLEIRQGRGTTRWSTHLRGSPRCSRCTPSPARATCDPGRGPATTPTCSG